MRNGKPKQERDMITKPLRRLQRYGSESGRISKSIAGFMQGPDVAQLGLYEEVALARTLLNDLVELYEQATCVAGDVTDVIKQKAVISMQPMLRDALDAVRALAKTATDIEASVSIQPLMVAALATTIQSTIVKLCGHDNVLLNEFEHELASVFTMLRRPDDHAEVLSPYETVKMLDDLVPHMEYNPEAIKSAEVSKAKPLEVKTWETLEDLDTESELE